MKSEIIESRTQKMWLSEDGILYVVMFTNVEITGADARGIVDSQMKLAGDQKRPLFVDARGIKKLTRKGREEFVSDDYYSIVLAAAVLIDSPVSKVITNLFMGINKPKVPMQLFTSESEAIEWLKGFLE